MRAWLLILLLLASALPAEKLKLKAEEREFDAALVSLAGDEVTYKRTGRREQTARLDEFEPPSQFIIRRNFTPEGFAPRLELARFALHRGLYEEAAQTAAAARELPGADARAADAVHEVAVILLADALVQRCMLLLEAGATAEARPLLERVRTEFAASPASPKAEVLLASLPRVELAVKARALAEEARKSQADADADEARRRKPIDDWLAGIEEQIAAGETAKREGDAEAAAGRAHLGLPRYESVVNEMTKLRQSVSDNRKVLTFAGQLERADDLDRRAVRLVVDCYERWVYYLIRMQRYEMANELCNKGIALAPGDRRLLALKVDLSELFDPTRPGG